MRCDQKQPRVLKRQKGEETTLFLCHSLPHSLTLLDEVKMEMSMTLNLLLAFLLPLASALKFDVLAHPGHVAASRERCIRNFVAKDQLVVVTATVSGNRGDGQTLNMHVRSNIT
jgi:hypothetical protein